MTQMNLPAASTSSPQCFSQTSSRSGGELASPDDSNSMVGSVESVRDRSHLFLDIRKKREPADLGGVVPSTTVAVNQAATTAACLGGSENAAEGSANYALSPMFQKDLLQAVSAMMSPVNRRAQFPFTTRNFGPATFGNLPKTSGVSASTTNFIAETPTPTKILYPKNVTKGQEDFADGFTKALEKLQAQNQLLNNNLNSPSSTQFLSLIAALTPTIANPPNGPSIGATAGNLTAGTGSAPVTVASQATATPPTQPAVPLPSPIANTGLSALIAALTPTPTHNSNPEQLFAAAFAAHLAASPSTSLPPSVPGAPVVTSATLPISANTGPGLTVAIPPPASSSADSGATSVSSVTSGSGANSAGSVNGSANTVTTTRATTVTQNRPSPLADIYKNFDSGRMDMFSAHDLNFPLMFNQNAMPPQPQSLSGHNGLGFPQNQMVGQQQPQPMAPHQNLTSNIKNEPGYPQSNAMCQPPPQSLGCPPSTSSHLSTNGVNGYPQHISMASTHVSEVDMSEQERRKLERKRARNRMAASKCRQRKIERISQLEGEVQQEKMRYSNLQKQLHMIENLCNSLRSEIEHHKQTDCKMPKQVYSILGQLNTIMANPSQLMEMDSQIAI